MSFAVQTAACAGPTKHQASKCRQRARKGIHWQRFQYAADGYGAKILSWETQPTEAGYFTASSVPLPAYLHRPRQSGCISTEIQPDKGNPRRCRFGAIRLNLGDKAGSIERFRVHLQETRSPTRYCATVKANYWFKGIYAFTHTAGEFNWSVISGLPTQWRLHRCGSGF